MATSDVGASSEMNKRCSPETFKKIRRDLESVVSRVLARSDRLRKTLESSREADIPVDSGRMADRTADLFGGRLEAWDDQLKTGKDNFYTDAQREALRDDVMVAISKLRSLAPLCNDDDDKKRVVIPSLSEVSTNATRHGEIRNDAEHLGTSSTEIPAMVFECFGELFGYGFGEDENIHRCWTCGLISEVSDAKESPFRSCEGRKCDGRYCVNCDCACNEEDKNSARIEQQYEETCRRCQTRSHRTFKCSGDCGEWYCWNCTDMPEEAIPDIAELQWKCSDCDLARESKNNCLICGKDGGSGQMAFCNGSGCNVRGHLRCMGYDKAKCHPETWLCQRCLLKSEKRTELKEISPSHNAGAAPVDADSHVDQKISHATTPSIETTIVATDPEIDGMKFWVDSPEIWFAQAEAYFILKKKSHDDCWKYSYLLTSLDRESLERVKTSVQHPPATEKYENLKRVILESYADRPPKREKTSKTEQSDILHCLDRRELLTVDSVKRLASGEWNGKPFVVQVIDMPPDGECLLSQVEFMFIAITDGEYKTIVRLSQEMAPIIKSYGGKLDVFPVINVIECRCDFVPKTKLLTEIPVLTKISKVKTSSTPASLDTPVLWSGSFEWTPYGGGPRDKQHSRTCSMTVPWAEFKNFKDINPGGKWDKHFAIDFLYPQTPGTEPNFPGSVLYEASRGGRVVFFSFDKDDPLLRELKGGVPAYVLFFKTKAWKERKLVFLEYPKQGNCVKGILPADEQTEREIMKRILRGLDAPIAIVQKEIQIYKVTEGKPPTDRELVERLCHEERLNVMQQRLDRGGPPLPVPKDLETIPITQILNKKVYVEKLKEVECFDSKRYDSLRTMAYNNRPLFKLCQCHCLTNEDCLFGVLLGHHRFDFGDRGKSRGRILGSTPVKFSLDDEKRSKLREIALKYEDRLRSGDVVADTSILYVEHMWENTTLSHTCNTTIDTMSIVLSLVGEDFNFLAEFRELFDDHFPPVVQNQARHHLLHSFVDVFHDPCDPNRESNVEYAKSWIKKVFQILRVPPEDPSDHMNEMVDFGVIANENDDPELFDCLAEIGLDPFKKDMDDETILHQAVKLNKKRVLKRGIELYLCNGLTVDQPNSDKETPFFSKMIDSATKNCRDTRDMLEDLLEAGADPLFMSQDYTTCLHVAVDHQSEKNIKLMMDMGYVVVRHRVVKNRARGKKGEVVDLAAKLAKRTLNKIFREEKVYFRVDWCDLCRKYTTRAPTTVESTRCNECFEKQKMLYAAQIQDWNELTPMSRHEATSVATSPVSLIKSLMGLRIIRLRNDFTPKEANEAVDCMEALGCSFRVSFAEMREFLVDSAKLYETPEPTKSMTREAALGEADAADATGLAERTAPAETVVERVIGEYEGAERRNSEMSEGGERRSNEREEAAAVPDNSESRHFCRYEHCIERDRAIAKPRDKCFVSASCHDMCSVTFHRSCWNSFKGEISTKSFLSGEAACMTPDCHATIFNVKTYDFEGYLKSDYYSAEDEDKGKKKKPSKSAAATQKMEERGKEKNKKGGKKWTPREESVDSASADVRPKKTSISGLAGEEKKNSEQNGTFQNQRPHKKSTSGPVIPPEVFLNIPEGQFVELKRREEDDEMIVGTNSKKKKKKKAKSSLTYASNDIRFNLYPDSSRPSIPPTAEMNNEGQIGDSTGGQIAVQDENLTVLPTPVLPPNISNGVQSDIRVDNLVTSNHRVDVVNDPILIPNPNDSDGQVRATGVLESANGQLLPSSREQNASLPPTLPPPLKDNEVLLGKRETALRLVLAYLKCNDGKVSAGRLSKVIDQWEEDAKAALNFPLFLPTLASDERRRMVIVKENDQDFIVINSELRANVSANQEDGVHDSVEGTSRVSLDDALENGPSGQELPSCIGDAGLLSTQPKEHEGKRADNEVTKAECKPPKSGKRNRGKKDVNKDKQDSADVDALQSATVGREVTAMGEVYEGSEEGILTRLEESTLIKEMAAAVSSMAEQVCAFEEQIQSQRETIAQQNEKFEKLFGTLDKLNARIEKQDARIEKQDARIEKQDARIERRDATIEKQHEIIKRLEVDKLRLRSQLRAIDDEDSDEEEEEEEEEAEEDICSICRESLFSQPTTVLPRCGHFFHQDCFAKYKGGVCPLCRTPIEEEFPPLPSHAFS